MKELKLNDQTYQIPDEVYDLVDGMSKELVASRQLINAASVAMLPVMAMLPMIINPASEAVNGLEMISQMGKLKADPNTAKNFTELKAAQENYAKVMTELNIAGA